MITQIKVTPVITQPMVLNSHLSKLLWDRAAGCPENITSGRISKRFLTSERDGDYLLGLRDGGNAEAGPVFNWLVSFNSLELTMEPLDGEGDDWK